MAVVLWMVGALLSFSATAIAIRMLAPTFSVFAILAVRTAAGVLLLLGFSLIRGEVIALTRTRRPLASADPQCDPLRRDLCLGAWRHTPASCDRVRSRVHNPGLGGSLGGSDPWGTADHKPPSCDRAGVR